MRLIRRRPQGDDWEIRLDPPVIEAIVPEAAGFETELARAAVLEALR